jgi:hypothetical protein
MVGFTIPPPGLCQAGDVDVLQLVRTWLILVNRIEEGSTHATTPCNNTLHERLGPGPEGDAGVLF